MVAHRTNSEKVEVLVGEVIHDESHGKRVRFNGREVDRYNTSEPRHVLYECGPGCYQILASHFDDGSEIYPESDVAVETGGLSYWFFTAHQAAAR
jgi:hypothetical protein